MHQENHNRFLTHLDTADYLHVSERTLARWRMEGVGPAFRRFGRRIVYALADIDAWADQRVYSSTSAPPRPWPGSERGEQ